MNETMEMMANARTYAGVRLTGDNAVELTPLLLDWPKTLLGEAAGAKVGDVFALEVVSIGNSLQDGNLVLKLRPIRIAALDRVVVTKQKVE